jgi:hypothetical protein
MIGGNSGDLQSAREVDYFENYLADPHSFPLDKDGRAVLGDGDDDKDKDQADDQDDNRDKDGEERPLVLPRLGRLSGPENAFYVSLARDKWASELIIPCLMVEIKVPDVIAFIERGRCAMCENSRYIVPDWDSGRAEKFDVAMHFSVYLVCPLCMGLDISKEHWYFHDEVRVWRCNSDPDDPEMKEWADDVDELIEKKLDELGY